MHVCLQQLSRRWLQMEFAPESWTVYGAPRVAWSQVKIHPQSGAALLELTLQLFNKTATRLPEAAMLSFLPPQSTSVSAQCRTRAAS